MDMGETQPILAKDNKEGNEEKTDEGAVEKRAEGGGGREVKHVPPLILGVEEHPTSHMDISTPHHRPNQFVRAALVPGAAAEAGFEGVR